MNRHWKTILALPLLFGVACGTINLPQSATPQHTDYHAPAHDAVTASVKLASLPENIVVNPATSGNYFDADIDYLATINYSAEGKNDTYAVELTEHAQTLNYSGAPLTWDIGINPGVPLALTVDSSSGDQTLNLKDFALTGLNVSSSSGKVEAQLPAGQYAAAFETSSGNVTLSLADQSTLNISTFKSSSGVMTLNSGAGSTVTLAAETSSGGVILNGAGGSSLTGSVTTSSGALALTFAADASAMLDVTTSAGALTVTVPKDAALRLQIDANSSGSVNVPAWLTKVSGDEKTGVWETEGFAQSEHQIVIHVVRSSSGAITVAEAG